MNQRLSFSGVCWECRQEWQSDIYEHVLEKLEDHAMETGHAHMDVTECL